MIKIILADDHSIVRNGIKMLLEAQHNLKVIGEANNGKGVLNILERGEQADLVLTDIHMVGMAGMELVDHLQKSHPHIKIVMLSMLEDIHNVKLAFEKGIRGYLVKNATYDELLFAIQHVAKGGLYLCGHLTTVLLETVTEKISKHDELEGTLADVALTEREVEILQLISEGYTNADIGEKLFLSKRTVEGHRHNLINRLKVKNSAELIKIAERNGLLD